jgi:RNase P/RNase MRP subunit p30
MAALAQAESSSGKTSSDVSYLKKVSETLKAEIRVFKQKEERLKTDLLPLMIEEIKAFKTGAAEIAAEHAVAPEPTQKLKSLADKFAAKLVMIFSKL